MPIFNETPMIFNCKGETLLGIVHEAESPIKTGVLLVVGGPQYRIGSHRQFLLLARFLAANGVAVMRFDYRGMGDSSGKLRTFEDVNDDIASAVDTFLKVCPKIEKICLWGLCDAASASLFYAYRDKRITNLILLNPWVRTDAGEAKAYLKHYYLSRLMSKDFWKKLLGGGVSLGSSLKSVADLSKAASEKTELVGSSLPEKMLDGLSKFEGETFIILSGEDLTAAEFRDLIHSNDNWKQVLGRESIEIKQMEGANHTFSSAVWRGEIEHWTLNWLLKKI